MGEVSILPISLMSQNEGLVKSIEALKQIIIFEAPGEMYWA